MGHISYVVASPLRRIESLAIRSVEGKVYELVVNIRNSSQSPKLVTVEYSSSEMRSLKVFWDMGEGSGGPHAPPMNVRKRLVPTNHLPKAVENTQGTQWNAIGNAADQAPRPFSPSLPLRPPTLLAQTTTTKAKPP